MLKEPEPEPKPNQTTLATKHESFKCVTITTMSEVHLEWLKKMCIRLKLGHLTTSEYRPLEFNLWLHDTSKEEEVINYLNSYND